MAGGRRAIADGPSILEYIRKTAREDDIERKIRFNHRVLRAEWSTAESRWTVEAARTDTEETVRLTCGFLYMCTGYYRYDQGYAPEFEGADRFTGEIVHPQHWPEDLDYDGKRVVVIGSGATAVTLIPAMADRAEHITMLQRSPSYVLSIPGRDPLAIFLRRVLPARIAHPIMRWRNAAIALLIFTLSRRAPRLMKGLLRKGIEAQLPEGYDVDPHFKPRYQPWDQRLCIVPDGDLFQTISRGDASVVTDRIETFTENGLRLASGAELDADLVITATGLNLLMLGGTEIAVDGRAIDLSEVMTYKGMMFTGIPNLALAVGYTNASWTLKADLVSEYVCRLLNHMEEHGYRQCMPHHPDPASAGEPLLDLASGYVLRSIDSLPKQGAAPPWRLHQNYARDVLLMRFGKLEDGAMQFSRGGVAEHQPPKAQAVA